jgi:hypothetical protein
MPNFHVHWLVAWQALDAIPGAARNGRDKYRDGAIERYAKRLQAAFSELAASNARGARARDAADALFKKAIPKLLRNWRKELYQTDDVREEVSCFSAYMLGACGPDFWTVPAKTGLGVIPDFGSIHFDLGHYNRTHQQFRRSIEKIGGKGDAQSNLERWYFLGMATHIAADLVVHELVNVSAGAYNLLKKKNWESEHPGFPNLKLWNAHNKVEHFWDSFVRYRYFGDLTDELLLFDPKQQQWIEPLGFPLAETLVLKVRKWENADLRDAVLAHLLHENKDRRAPDQSRKTRKTRKTPAREAAVGARVLIETPLVFTAIACDRILKEAIPGGGAIPEAPTLDPFIYDRVVNKEIGAYPRRMVFDDAIQEAYEDQMTDDRWFRGGGFNEVRRLRYFGTKKNSDQSPYVHALNFLNFVVCPDLDRLLEEGPAHALGQAFSDVGALKEVGNRAVGVAKAFANRILAAYSGSNPDALGDVGMFWNLDTGLGLEVQAGKTSTEKEVVTRLDFVHVLSARIKNPARKEEGDLGYVRDDAPSTIEYLARKGVQASEVTTPKKVAFPVRTEGDGVAQPFPSLAAVKEPDAERYLDRIRVEGDAVERWADVELGKIQEQPDDPPSVRAERRTQKFLDLFFAKAESALGWHNLFGSVTKEMKRVFSLQQVRERISLELRVPIPAISEAGDEPGFFLYGDEAPKVGDAAELAPHDWLQKKAKLIGSWSGEAVEARGALRTATARILLNVRKSEERKIEAGVWNNVVPYGASKQFYGRNFAVATGRKYVLSPAGSGAFDPHRDFRYYDKVTPTEHIFLTIYPLVKTPWGVVDAFSDEEVSRSDLDDKIRRITGLEWKKVVLFYRLEAPKGAAPRLVQLKRCFIDGIDVPVAAAPTDAGAMGAGDFPRAKGEAAV